MVVPSKLIVMSFEWMCDSETAKETFQKETICVITKPEPQIVIN